MSFVDDLNLFLDLYKLEDVKRYEELLDIKTVILNFKKDSLSTLEQVDNLIAVYCLFAKYTPEKFNALFTGYTSNDSKYETAKNTLLATFEAMRTAIVDFGNRNFV